MVVDQGQLTYDVAWSIVAMAGPWRLEDPEGAFRMYSGASRGGITVRLGRGESDSGEPKFYFDARNIMGDRLFGGDNERSMLDTVPENHPDNNQLGNLYRIVESAYQSAQK